MIIMVEEVLSLIKTGYVKMVGDAGYDPLKKNSLMDKYNLSRSEIRAMFQDDRLKGKKVVMPKVSKFTLKSASEVNYGETSKDRKEEKATEVAEF